MAYNWSQVYEQQAQPQQNEEMMLLERRAQLEAQQKQQDYENQLNLLRQSNEYNNASTKQRIEMEAQLLAMREGFLPTDRVANLLGIQSPQAQGQYNRGGGSRRQGEPTNSGLIGGSLGASVGALNPAVMTKLNGVLGGGMNSAGAMIRHNPLTDKIGTGGANILTKAMKNPSTSILNKMLQGGAKGLSMGTGGLEAGTTLLGKGISKAGLGLAGKSLGKLGGAVVGSIPGFLIGTAIGELIGKLLEGNDEDKAKAEYLLEQYR